MDEILTPELIEEMYKKFLPHINALSEIAHSYIPDADFRGIFSLAFRTDGSFLLESPIGCGNKMSRSHDELFPLYVDDDFATHQMVKENGRIKWKTTT